MTGSWVSGTGVGGGVVGGAAVGGAVIVMVRSTSCVLLEGSTAVTLSVWAPTLKLGVITFFRTIFPAKFA
jgi:hypothetical protein